MSKPERYPQILFSENSKRIGKLFKKGMENDKKIVSLSEELERLNSALAVEGEAGQVEKNRKKIQAIEVEVERLKADNNEIDKELNSLSKANVLENNLLLRGDWPKEGN